MSTDKDLLQYSVKGFTDPWAMEQDARKASGLAYFELIQSSPPKQFDFDYLKSIHKDLFRDVYSFAGKTRDEMDQNDPFRNMIISDPDRPDVFQRFTPGDEIQNHAAEIFGELEKENNLKGLDKDQFSDRLAHYIDQVNQLHPFREGNGRSTRIFFDKLAENACYSMDWRMIDRHTQVEAFKSAAESYQRNGDVAVKLPDSEDKMLVKKVMGQIVDHKERDTDRDRANAFRNHVVNPEGGVTLGVEYYPEIFATSLWMAETKRYLKDKGTLEDTEKKIIATLGEKIALSMEQGEYPAAEKLANILDSIQIETGKDNDNERQ